MNLLMLVSSGPLEVWGADPVAAFFLLCGCACLWKAAFLSGKV